MRHEHDREDLLREATALVERAEFACDDWPHTPLIIGFRRSGSGSLYVGQDLMLQFDANLQLRRAFHQNQLLKADAGRLVAIRKQRTADAVLLQRRELSDPEQAALVQLAVEWLCSLHQRLIDGRLRLVGKVPADSSVVERITAWLGQLRAGFSIAPRL